MRNNIEPNLKISSESALKTPLDLSLEILQHTFANALLDANHVEPALALLKGAPDLIRKRLGFYRGNVIGNWQDACVNAYPVLQQLMGEDFFNQVIRAYGLTHASQSGDLAEFGASLSSYLSTLGNCREYPYFGDVAALEWQVHRAYYSKQSRPVTLVQLASIPPAQLTELCFQFQATCELFQSPWAVADIWHTLENTDVPSLPDQLFNTSHCLIWRAYDITKWKVQVASISAASYIALQRLALGEKLGQALEAALEENPEFDVQTELADWFGKQIFSEIILNN